MDMAYNSKIIGRHYEQDVLGECVASDKAEFVAVYGRRRVGKTYLIKQYFQEGFDFYASGIYNISNRDQLESFRTQLEYYSGQTVKKLRNWFDAFNALRQYLSPRMQQGKVIVFIDELPWMDAHKSNFIRALEAFWNMWGADQPNLKLIVCGSATTWMTNKLLGDKGGLHNRVTRRINLHPFTLAETVAYLISQQIEWSRLEILDCYMVMGGTPFYLSMLRRSESLQQNIDRLFFGEDAELRDEYDFLFRSLFKDAVGYKRIIETIAGKVKGLTRKELTEQLKIESNGRLTEILDNLCKCDFLRSYSSFGKKDREVLYQLSDLYCLFYLRFVKDYRGRNPHAWTEMSAGKRNAWNGYAFEQVCLAHLDKIRQALGIAGVASDASTWQYQGLSGGGQIDLVIDRADRTVDLCEMKYSDHPYEITKDYAEYLVERRELFRQVTKTTKTLRLTFVTPFGIKPGLHASAANSVVTLDELF